MDCDFGKKVLACTLNLTMSWCKVSLGHQVSPPIPVRLGQTQGWNLTSAFVLQSQSAATDVSLVRNTQKMEEKDEGDLIQILLMCASSGCQCDMSVLKEGAPWHRVLKVWMGTLRKRLHLHVWWDSRSEHSAEGSTFLPQHKLPPSTKWGRGH